ncbi:hypothetical protein KFL_004580060 [Klebsormidium nitens]|uniref:Uncharacterized protein n=1 Tax=Klebsormidium nitens TaxID=105231 RepID=A0A1Y1IJH4_KLENI|nr:hypothetical protein KFL_004580060 [Klebsormidium nitens]|eukprot:GAQ88777.1 hypothetical protein KFL_004580060 [Klebsormidium nitens]
MRPPVIASRLPETIPDDHLLYRFLDGLQPNITERVHLVRPSTWEEAVNAAEYFEALDEQPADEPSETKYDEAFLIMNVEEQLANIRHDLAYVEQHYENFSRAALGAVLTSVRDKLNVVQTATMHGPQKHENVIFTANLIVDDQPLRVEGKKRTLIEMYEGGQTQTPNEPCERPAKTTDSPEQKNNAKWNPYATGIDYEACSRKVKNKNPFAAEPIHVGSLVTPIFHEPKYKRAPVCIVRRFSGELTIEVKTEHGEVKEYRINERIRNVAHFRNSAKQ